MTRETAIALLNNLRAFSEEDDEPAIDMAIESLQKDIERYEMVIRASERHLGLVRCKDCKYWNEWENMTGSCHRSENGYNWFGVDATDFCSFGERREL